MICDKVNEIDKNCFVDDIVDKSWNDVFDKLFLCEWVSKNGSGNYKYVGDNVLKFDCYKSYNWELDVKNFFCFVLSVERKLNGKIYKLVIVDVGNENFVKVYIEFFLCNGDCFF